MKATSKRGKKQSTFRSGNTIQSNGAILSQGATFVSPSETIPISSYVDKSIESSEWKVKSELISKVDNDIKELRDCFDNKIEDLRREFVSSQDKSVSYKRWKISTVLSAIAILIAILIPIIQPLIKNEPEKTVQSKECNVSVSDSVQNVKQNPSEQNDCTITPQPKVKPEKTTKTEGKLTKK